MGYPVCIEGSKFSRNALWFNLFFLVENVSDIARFAPVIEKIGRTLVTLEVDSNFLSERTSHERIPGILEEVYFSLANEGECSIPVDDYTSLFLQLKQRESDALALSMEDHEVPALVKQIPEQRVLTWDLTAQQILPFINGVRTVSQLSVASSVDLSLTKSCLQRLLLHGCLTILDAFSMLTCMHVPPPFTNLPKVPLSRKSVFDSFCARTRYLLLTFFVVTVISALV